MQLILRNLSDSFVSSYEVTFKRIHFLIYQGERETCALRGALLITNLSDTFVSSYEVTFKILNLLSTHMQ